MILKYSKFLLLSISIFSIFFINSQSVFATNTSSLSPATMADDSSVGAATWTNVDNAMASDDVYATAQSFCFVAGTKIKTANGEANIEDLLSGQYVLGFDSNEQIKNSKVNAVSSREVDEVIKVLTDTGEVIVTAEHPFYIGSGNFEQIQNINVGDYVYDSNFVPHQILSKTIIHEKTTVYNLEVDDTHTYFANNFAVHNKTIWHYLKATNFGFAIPAGATINGIRAEIEMITNNGTGGVENVRIVKGGVIGSTDKGIFNNNMPTTEISTFYGSSTDLWGETWTAEDINSSNFGFAYSVNINAKTVSVDHMAIVVTYTADVTSPSVTLDSPLNGATITGSSVSLTATASDNIAVAGVKFYIDGTLIGSEDTTSTYSGILDSTGVADGTHDIVAVARDTANNYATSTIATVTVDNTGPIISSISSGDPSTTGATISWTTANEVASSSVVYGLTSAVYNRNVSDDALTNSHSITLEDLVPGTMYYFKVSSSDALGNVTTSSENTFTTASLATNRSGSRRHIVLPINNLAIAPVITSTSTPDILSINKDLKYGMNDPLVLILQRYLNTHGFVLSATGAGSVGSETDYFGPATRNSLISFQKAKGINPALGYFGPITRAYIGSH